MTFSTTGALRQGILRVRAQYLKANLGARPRCHAHGRPFPHHLTVSVRAPDASGSNIVDESIQENALDRAHDR